MEPETLTDGEGCCLASEDESPSGWYIFQASKLGGGSEGEEVDAAKDSRRKVEEKHDSCHSGCHDRCMKRKNYGRASPFSSVIILIRAPRPARKNLQLDW